VTNSVGRRLVAVAAAAAAAAAGPWLPGPVGFAAPRSTAPPPQSQQASSGLLLKVSRQAGGVALIIEGTGPAPQLVQSTSSNGWQGQLITANASALQQGPQRLSLPEFGLQQVTLTGSGTSFQLDVLPSQGLPLTRPVVSADGKNLIVTFAATPQASLQTVRPNLNQPGAVPQATYAPPLQPRAVAPPLGDMAIGTMMLRNFSFINLRGPRITMTLRNASAKDVLMSLARIGNYGFVYVDEAATSASQASPATAPASNQPPGSSAAPPADNSPKVNISFVNEDFSRAFNAVLLSSGLSAKLEGGMILAGKGAHGKSFGARLSKIYRLNQVSPESAADYLANLGASVTKTNTISTSVSTGTSQATAVQGSPSSSTTTSSTTTSVEVYSAGIGPLVGLQATTDARLDTITMIGDPALVAVAEQYLKQLDLRQRQVALSVKILDVTLDNNSQISNSFAFRSGSSFILSDNGNLTATFGSLTPQGRPNPGSSYPDNQLLDQIQALVQSSATKVLASPTLILSENAESTGGSAGGGSGSGGSVSGASGSSSGGSSGGGSIGRSQANEGSVTVGETVITGYTAVTNQTSTVCTPEKTDAGLSFAAKVHKIDDNGFVTFTMSPEISAQLPGGSVPGCGPFFNIAKRRLDTGSLRVRDGQTLILTGVINEDVQSIVRKWPILGDLPLIGQFFRSTGTNRGKNELVIMVTPRILREDDSSDPYGYGYRPSSQDARQFMSGL